MATGSFHPNILQILIHSECTRGRRHNKIIKRASAKFNNRETGNDCVIYDKNYTSLIAYYFNLYGKYSISSKYKNWPYGALFEFLYSPFMFIMPTFRFCIKAGRWKAHNSAIVLRVAMVSLLYGLSLRNRA